MTSPKPLDWVVVPTGELILFCRHCQLPEWKHVDGKCLFEATVFEAEPHADTVKRLVAEKFVGSPLTPQLQKEMAAFVKQTLEDLQRKGTST